MEEACTVWKGVLIDQKVESTSTDMPLGTAIYDIEITLGKGGQLVKSISLQKNWIIFQQKDCFKSEKSNSQSAAENYIFLHGCWKESGFCCVFSHWILLK